MSVKYRGKILICEDGDRGHRPVILRYVKKALERYGVPYELSNHSQADVRGAFIEARRLNCTGVHFLTVDGAIRSWLKHWVWLPAVVGVTEAIMALACFAVIPRVLGEVSIFVILPIVIVSVSGWLLPLLCLRALQANKT